MWNDDDALFDLLAESASHVEEYGLVIDLKRLNENGALAACLPKNYGGSNWAFTQTETETKQILPVSTSLSNTRRCQTER